MSHGGMPNVTSLGVAAALGAALAVTGARDASASGGKLLVYLHVAVKQRALQGLLATRLPGITTTAVGRIADFDRALKDGPDAVLTLPIVLSARGFVPTLRGLRQGSLDERYALVGTGAAPEPSRVTSVGALDVLGREGTNGFVHTLINAQARVERVTKIEDLLPLLQMQRVDAVLLPSRLFPELRAASRLSLAQRELDKPVGLPAATGIRGGGSAILAAIARLPKDVSNLLGVDGWR